LEDVVNAAPKHRRHVDLVRVSSALCRWPADDDLPYFLAV